MRLIDADAIKREAFEVKTKEYGLVDVVGVDAIDEAPTIDPVRHGDWVNKTYTYENMNGITEERSHVVCSECGTQPPSGFGKVNFCHRCGAKMDGGDPK
jgi:hypothetical protein